MNTTIRSDNNLNDVLEDKLLTRLIGIIAHDIKSPIEQSLLFLSLLDDERLSDDDYLVFKNAMQKHLTTSQTIINGLLDWIKGHISGQNGLNEKVCLYSITNTVIGSMEYLSSGYIFNVLNKVPEELEFVINARIYEVVLRNLLTNAIKFSGKDADISVTIQQGSHMLKTVVTDTGVGMSEQKVRKIFKGHAGFSVTTGSGIGLILCRDCLKHYGGELAIKSIEGKGTTASFSLPYNIL